MARRPQLLSMVERQARLDTEIARRVRLGWRVVQRTATTAQLARTRPWWSALLVASVSSVLPAFVYHAAAQETVTPVLEVTDEGHVRRRVAARE